jgi:polysaccharide pyruvyl transferase WcaK-like protein
VRIAFISPCGYGNLGDVAIQDAFIRGVREQLGDGAEITGITQNPADTEHRHHVRAIPMDADAFRLRPASSETSSGGTGEQPEDSPRHGGSVLRGVAVGVKRALKEVIHWRIAFREMRNADVLVVSGGGQLDDHWGGPWGVPYALWKWSLAARLLHTDVLFLSVGAGTTDSALTRYFLRAALRRARYASFRDERTVRRVSALRLSSSTRVVPDLAFGHDGRRTAHEHRGRHERPTIAISPIAFLDPIAWPAKDVHAYRANLLRTARLGQLLLGRGYDVVLCTSDTPDVKSARELIEAIDAPANGVRTGPPGSVALADIHTPAQLLESFVTADVAVASRLHGLILANLAATPTVALSYDWKVDEHMRAMGLERYTFPIDAFDPEEVVAAIEEMLAQRKVLAADVAARCDTFAGDVRAQFELVFGAGTTASGSAGAT